jgi:integrase
MELVAGVFPRSGLRFPKSRERAPFQSRAEIERRLQAGGMSPAEIADAWQTLYLRVEEIEELLKHVRAKPAHPFVHPMFCFVAHTGARRSEVLRATIADLDMEGRTVLLNERKRVKGKATTRRVPLSPALHEMLAAWLRQHPGGPHLFCQAQEAANRKRGAALKRDEAHDHFRRALAGSKWEVVRGFHTLRHSFISALASRGIDQRLIDEFVGHQTEEQRRRYRHLYPSVKQEAIASVFGEKS